MFLYYIQVDIHQHLKKKLKDNIFAIIDSSEELAKIQSSEFGENPVILSSYQVSKNWKRFHAANKNPNSED